MTDYVYPAPKQFWDMMHNVSDGPIEFLNLICFYEKANYPDGREATGVEAYNAYAKAAGPIYERLGGKILWRGIPDFVVIGPQEHQWDFAYIAEFPSLEAYGELVGDLAYQAVVFHRQAAVKDTRLIRMKPNDLDRGFQI